MVEAKLLGVRLLSLKAHVVTGPPSALAALTSAATLTTLPATTTSALVVRPTQNGRSDTLSTAMELLAQSSTALRRLPS